VDGLHGNLKQFTESGSGPIKLLRQGEVAVGLALTFQAVSEINDKQPFEIIFTSEGPPYSLTGTAILDTHQDKEGVREVFAQVMSHPAAEVLQVHGIGFQADLYVEGIVNRSGTGPCPFEAAVMDIQEAHEALAAIRNKRRQLQEGK